MYDPKDVFALVDQLAPSMGVDPRTAKMLIGAEQVWLDRETGGYKMPTTFSPRASHVGAQGVGQVMPATLEALKSKGMLPKDFSNDGSLRSQVLASLAAIKEMAPRAGGDPLRLAAMYNGGSAAGRKYGTPEFATAPEETRNHVEKAKFMLTQLGDTGDSETNREARAPVRGTAAAPATPAAVPATPAGGNSALPFNIPGLESVMALYGGVNAATNAATEGLRGYQAEANAGLAQSTQAVAALAEAEKAAANARIDKETILTNRKNAIAEQFGASEAQQQVLRDAYVANEAARTALESTVNEQMAVGFFDNPLKYLANMTTLPGLVAQHNAMARKSEELQTEIVRRQQNAQQQTATTAALVAEPFSREQLAMADSRAAEAMAKLAQLRTENAGTNAKNLLSVLSAETGRLQTAAQLAAIARAERREDREYEKMQEQEKADLIEIDSINKMLEPIGGKLEPKLWKTLSAAQKYPLTQLTARGNYGNSLAEAYETITELGLYNRSKADPAMAGFMDAITAELPKRIAELQKADIAGKAKPAELRQRALAAIEAEWRKPLDKGVDRERFTTGPYALDYNLAHINGKYKGTFIGDVLAERAKQDVRGGASSVRFSDLEDAAMIAITSKKLTPAQAAKQLSQFYQQEQLAKYNGLGLFLYNMPKPEGYTVYGVNSNSFFGNPQEIDAANPASLENYFVFRQVQQERMRRPPSLFNPGGGEVGNPMIR